MTSSDDQSDVSQSWYQSWHEEKQAVFLYQSVAAAEPDAKKKELFLGLAQKAEIQAGLLAKSLGTTPVFRPSVRARILALAVQCLGPRALRRPLAAFKVRGVSVYERLFPQTHETPHTLSDVGRRHDIGSSASGNIRAAVFGANDGLVSNASLILGVAAAASFDTRTVVISGAAGLLAGALSMAAGEYVSVKSQRELLEYQLDLEKAELERYPEEEAAELALIYEARGLPKADAERISSEIVKDPVRALDILAREELGVNPNELGSPLSAAIASFVSFATGAILPLAPFLVSTKGAHVTLYWSLGLTAAALFATGVIVSFFSGKSAVWSGSRMLLIGGGAGLISYVIGSLIGGITA